MAKCITNGEIVVRVSNENASEKVDSGKWRYVAKKVWKRFLKTGEMDDFKSS